MDLSLIEIVVRVLVGGGLGFVIGMTAVGGGVLGVPVLVLFGLPPTTAVGTASLYSLLTKGYAAVLHFRQRTVDMPMVAVLLAGALPGTLVTAWLISRYASANSGEALARFQFALTVAIVCVMIVALFLMITSIRRKRQAADSAPPERTALPKVVGAAIGLLIGVVLAATSIGGGVVMIPVLMLIFGLPASRTVGTSTLVSIVLTMMAALIYGANGQLSIATAVFMSIGSLIGAPLGARMTKKLPERQLQVIIVTVMAVAILVMLTQLLPH